MRDPAGYVHYHLNWARLPGHVGVVGILEATGRVVRCPPLAAPELDHPVHHVPSVAVMAISETPQSRSAKLPTPGVLVSLVVASFRPLFSGPGLVGA